MENNGVKEGNANERLLRLPTFSQQVSERLGVPIEVI